MRKNKTILWYLVIALTIVAAGCKEKVPPLSERIAKAWSPQSVTEGSTVVFTKGGANNTRPGYANWRLTLNSSGTATYTEFDNNTFTGQWEVQGDNRLILKNLNPQPTGTGGTIEFTISDFTDAGMTLTRTTTSTKTGGTINKYTLTNP
ncbi:hypothetical protein [Telluribacter humicola]|uniref:hypothetical protein n=1 Tax=Telluribacter humicola TaxID=1720261 RepID=UPI001A961809|nr:hypothetical protein [Telluribacter humicola]